MTTLFVLATLLGVLGFGAVVGLVVMHDRIDGLEKENELTVNMLGRINERLDRVEGNGQQL